MSNLTVKLTKVCECEHISHFDDNDKLTPNGAIPHKYGVSFDIKSLVDVGTPYGKFIVCKDCAEDCLKQFVNLGK